jgi:hypothetical protein
VTAIDTTKAGEPTRRIRTARVVVMFVVLVVGAVILLGQEAVIERVRAGSASADTLLYAPTLFLLLAVVVAGDAILWAVRRRFFTGRALLQVVVALVLAAFVGSTTWRELQARRVPLLLADETLSLLFVSNDARVRALVVEVAARRGVDDPALEGILRRGLDDKDPLVWRTVLATRFSHLLDLGNEESARRAARAELDGVPADGQNGETPP